MARAAAPAVDPWMQEIGGPDVTKQGEDGVGFDPSQGPASSRAGLGSVRSNAANEDNMQPGYTIATGDPDDPFTAFEDSFKASGGGHPHNGDGLHLARWTQASNRFDHGSHAAIKSLNLGSIMDPTQVANPGKRQGDFNPNPGASSTQPWGQQQPVSGGSTQPDYNPRYGGSSWDQVPPEDTGSVSALAAAPGVGSAPARPASTAGGAFPGSSGSYGGLPLQGANDPNNIEVTGGKMGNRNNPIAGLVEKVRSYTNAFQPHWNNTATAGGLFGSINVPSPADFIKISGGFKQPHAYVDTRYLTAERKPWLDLSKEEWMPSDMHKPI